MTSDYWHFNKHSQSHILMLSLIPAVQSESPYGFLQCIMQQTNLLYRLGECTSETKLHIVDNKQSLFTLMNGQEKVRHANVYESRPLHNFVRSHVWSLTTAYHFYLVTESSTSMRGMSGDRSSCKRKKIHIQW